MRFFIIVLGLLAGTSAHAVFMIEPSISYNSGSLKATSAAGVASVPTDYTGPGAGLRLLYATGGTYMGLEGTYVAGKGKTGTVESDISDANAGVILGYASMDFRIYAAYMPFSEVQQKEQLSEATIFKGTSAKLGLGIFLSSRLSISAEIMTHMFTKVKTGTTELEIKDVYGTLKDDPVAVTLAYLF